MLFSLYPYHNFSDYNLDWLIKQIKLFGEQMDTFISINSIKYADPIAWDITRQYEQNTVVIDPFNEIAYLSKKAVPSGVSIENEEYWTPIFNFNIFKYYDTATEMLNDELLHDLSYVYTCGFYTLNDGGGGLYKITETAIDDFSIPASNGKYATLIYNEVLNVKCLGVYGDGIHDDTAKISAILNGFSNVLFPSGTYVFNGEVQVDVAKKITGIDATIKTTENISYPYKWHFKNRDDIEVSGFTFDSNLMGRGSILLDYACKNAHIHHCTFTGYSAINGHYQTDSQLYDNGNFHTIIDNCLFINNGFQYGTSDATLNRCIGVSKGVEGEENYAFGGARIYACRFVRFNQGIVSDSEDLTISDCYFEQNKDNCLYLFGKTLIDNCQFINAYDEDIVIGSNSSYVITNCYFRNGANKVIASSGNVNSLTIKGCTFETESSAELTARCLEPRSYSSVWKYVNIDGNTFDIKNEKTGSEIVIPNFEHCEFNNNIIRWNATNSGVAAVNFSGSYDANDFVTITNNHFENYSQVVTQYGYSTNIKNATHTLQNNLFGNRRLNTDDIWYLKVETTQNTTSNLQLVKSGNAVALRGTITTTNEIARYSIMLPNINYVLGNNGIAQDLIFKDRTNTYEIRYVSNNGYLMNWTAIPANTTLEFDYSAFYTI